MSNTKTIEHNGIVKNIAGNSIIVSIIKNSGCISCQAKESCNISEIEEKEIEVRQFDSNYSIGEHVKVYFSKPLGFHALFLGYFLPFVIVLIVLILFTIIGAGEGEAGLLAIGALVPYYFIIFIRRNKLKKTFSFSIKKASNKDLLKNVELHN